MAMIDAPLELCWTRLCDRRRGLRWAIDEEQVYGAGLCEAAHEVSILMPAVSAVGR
jgi:hypothetical protein